MHASIFKPDDAIHLSSRHLGGGGGGGVDGVTCLGKLGIFLRHTHTHDPHD